MQVLFLLPFGLFKIYLCSQQNISYCKDVPFRCSYNRSDNDYITYYDSRCYCDWFCYYHSHDCCPDFEITCLNIQSTFGTKFTSFQAATTSTESIQRRTTQLNLLSLNDLVKNINNANKGWTAFNYYNKEQFVTGELLTKMFGVEKELLKDISKIKIYRHDPGLKHFKPNIHWDVRKNSRWPISKIRNHSDCPVSWIISAVDVVADRFARLNYINNIWNVSTEPISFMHMLSCSFKENYFKKCNEAIGTVEKAWKFLHRIGTVLDRCYPSTVLKQAIYIEPCQLLMRKSVKSQLYTGGQYASLRCPNQIKAKRTLFFRTGNPYRLKASYKDIQYEIFLRGSVQATILACPDFLLYKSGVYQNLIKDSQLCRYHSVRIIGWGHVSDKNHNVRLYWICANSFGREWGLNGFFKIYANESEVSDWVVTTFGHGEFYPF